MAMLRRSDGDLLGLRGGTPALLAVAPLRCGGRGLHETLLDEELLARLTELGTEDLGTGLDRLDRLGRLLVRDVQTLGGELTPLLGGVEGDDRGLGGDDRRGDGDPLGGDGCLGDRTSVLLAAATGEEADEQDGEDDADGDAHGETSR